MAINPCLSEEINPLFLESREVLFPGRLVRPAGTIVTANDDVLRERIELWPHARQVSLGIERPLCNHEASAMFPDRLVQLQHIVKHEVRRLADGDAVCLQTVNINLSNINVEQLAGERLAQFINHGRYHADGLGFTDVKGHDPGRLLAGSNPQMLVLGFIEDVIGMPERLK